MIGVKSVALESALTNPEMEVNGKSVKKNQNLAKVILPSLSHSRLSSSRLKLLQEDYRNYYMNDYSNGFYRSNYFSSFDSHSSF